MNTKVYCLYNLDFKNILTNLHSMKFFLEKC